MPSFLTDENFDNRILDGLLLRKRDIDVVRTQDVGLEGQKDPIVLHWAAERGRILLTHDASTNAAVTVFFLRENVVLDQTMICSDTPRTLSGSIKIVFCFKKDYFRNQEDFLHDEDDLLHDEDDLLWS